jgi:hypothetical protein
MSTHEYYPIKTAAQLSGGAAAEPMVPQPAATPTIYTEPLIAAGSRPADLLTGPLLYSARFSRDALRSFYCLSGQCIGRDAAIDRVFFDVHADAVRYNFPCVWNPCCFCPRAVDRVNTVHYDRHWFVGLQTPASQAGCCNPCPIPAPHCCGVCGDVLSIQAGCCPAFDTFHVPGQTACCTGSCFRGAGLTFGLERGEASVLAGHLNRAVDRQREQLRPAGYAGMN